MFICIYVKHTSISSLLIDTRLYSNRVLNLRLISKLKLHSYTRVSKYLGTCRCRDILSEKQLIILKPVSVFTLYFMVNFVARVEV